MYKNDMNSMNYVSCEKEEVSQDNGYPVLIFIHLAKSPEGGHQLHKEQRSVEPPHYSLCIQPYEQTRSF